MARGYIRPRNDPDQRPHRYCGEVAKLGLRMPQDYLAVYDSTMARFWFFDETARQRVTDLMNSLDSGQVLTKEDDAAVWPELSRRPLW